jgi:hypothetical protein
VGQGGRLCRNTEGLAAIAANAWIEIHQITTCLLYIDSNLACPCVVTPLLLQYLCTGLEDDILRRKLEAAAAAEAAGGSKVAALSEVDQLVQACGKMVLLHKLLPKLKAEGHKVGGWVDGWVGPLELIIGRLGPTRLQDTCAQVLDLTHKPRP